jgi:hypothetical protein
MSGSSAISFEGHDKLGLKPFCEKFESFLLIDHDFVEGSLVVSLNAPFGAGKTTFLSMWRDSIDKRRQTTSSLPKVITVNAWESDYCGDPLLSIVTELIKTISGGASTETEVAKKLHEAAKDVGWFVTGLANNLASKWTGIDPVSAGEFAHGKKKERKEKLPDFVNLYNERTAALAKLKTTLREVFGGDAPKAFIFVDELDRCRPDYAVNYLETIKHVFDVHGLVFVLAIDYDQLECSAKALFGQGLKFHDYFRKFSHRTVALPEPSEPNLHMLTFSYVKQYLEKEGKRTSMLHVDEARMRNIVKLVIELKMPPRQIQEMFRIIGHTLAAIGQTHRGQLYWCIGLGTILMAALKVAESKMYKLIGREKATHSEVGNFLVEIIGKRSAHWWFCIYVAGTQSDESRDPEKVEALLHKLELIGKDVRFNINNEFSDFVYGWGNGSTSWKKLFENIESANVLGP